MPSPIPIAILSLLLRPGPSTTLTSSGFEGVEDGAAAEAEAFIIEIENVVGLMLEVVIGAVKATKSGLKIPIPESVLRQFASRVSQTGPRKADPQRVLVHIATAFKKVTLEHKQAFDITRVVMVMSGQPDAMASANKHG